ncbi:MULTISPECIES: hypothetical protein [Vibrio]|uniref:Uncharacterized protein n=1 Tax=Vibrio parahaemolyticus TaxID=670 RepID=A0AA47JJ99_VIBPH|nr:MULTISPECIES: hypothetical protein [Vibrio]EMA2427003.1 hypothetical protein [Vibrio alginolyticus]MDK9735599.1 hypothetical protein [Vibrio sp. B511a]MEA5351048.1 hypothetical protein [Vibrio parahaemolyticus]WAT91743.1 hypothetical protein O1Q84_07965 [Vibrio parahaemolyticus]
MADNGDKFDSIRKIVEINSVQLDKLSSYSDSTTKDFKTIANKLEQANRVLNSADMPLETRNEMKSIIVDIIDTCKNMIDSENTYRKAVQLGNKELIQELVSLLELLSQTSEGDSHEQSH